MNNNQYGSGEYSPTPSHQLPAFVNGKPTGYICLKCGHICKELDPIWDDVCPICLREWAKLQGVPKLIPTEDAIKGEALEPTKRIDNTSQDQTTRIMNLNPKKGGKHRQ